MSAGPESEAVGVEGGAGASKISRRGFIGGAGTALAGMALAACSGAESAAQQAGGATAGATGGAAAGSAAEEARGAGRGRLGGQVALVTGAARGIGRAVSVALAREGADVAVVDIAGPIATVTQYDLATPGDLEETARQVRELGRRALVLRADVRDFGRMQEGTDRTIRELGRLDVLVANAGISVYSTLAETTPEAFRDVVDVNLLGVASSIKAAAPHMAERGSGRVIAVASTEGRHGAPALSSYVASKWGVIGLVKAMAYELGQAGVTVNAISPTGVRTAMTENEATYRWANPDEPTRENLEAALRQYNALPVGRLEPEDVAEGVVFLASPEARHVSGAALDLAAGANARYTA